jgi:hypothetical protein
VQLADVNEAPTLSHASRDIRVLSGRVASLNLAELFADVDAQDRLSFHASALPAGFSLNPEGVLSGQGVPTTSPHSFTITATDSAGASVQGVFALSVVNQPGIVSLTPGAQTPATVKPGTTVDFVVGLSEAVSVTGSPVLNLTVNGKAVQATYVGSNDSNNVSNSGTDQLVFSATIPQGSDGQDIRVVSVTLQNGAIVGQTSGQALLLLPSGVRTQALTVDSVAPVAPTLTLLDTGLDTADGITRLGTVTLGPLESGAKAAYSTDAGDSWTDLASSTAFTLNPGPLLGRQGASAPDRRRWQHQPGANQRQGLDGRCHRAHPHRAMEPGFGAAGRQARAHAHFQ